MLLTFHNLVFQSSKSPMNERGSAPCCTNAIAVLRSRGAEYADRKCFATNQAACLSVVELFVEKKEY